MTRRSATAKTFHASEIQKLKPNQVFYSPGGRRGWILLTALVIVACLVAIAIDWARTITTALPPTAAHYNTSVNYPREIADAVDTCAAKNGQYGDNGALQVPVIGTGVFQRVVKIVPDGDTDYAVDPFTGQVYRPLTQLEAHGARCGYAVEEYGTVPNHTLILTYDDGPSGQWTPLILGILDAYHVHATFFNIGSQDLLYQNVFRAVLAHGNAVGNHSYTHPYLVQLSNAAARNELVETARVQAQVGDYQSRIWRTPYQGGDPVSAGNGMFDTLVGQQLGLTEVGFTNDTSDYALVGKEIPPPPLSRSASSPGMVVIMHDGGGNRASTVALTEKVVRQGVSYGYTFMTIPQLLAEQPGWHGPVISRNVAPTRVDTAGYWLKAYAPALQGWYADFIRYMTVVIITISVLVLICAAFDRWLSYRRPPEWQPESLGVLIPCWKESKVIRNTVERVLHAAEGCPFPLHIVLVDDGSADNDPTDKTWQILCELAAEYPEVRAVQQHNGGKARALNFGLQYVTSDLVVVMDADTIPKDAQAFRHLVRWFGDSRVGAVAGYTKAGDRGKGWRQHVIAEFQAAEYDLGIALIRSVQNLSNSIVIVPGAFSAFRTEWLREVGFLPDRVVAEDAEAPQRMRRVRPRMRILQDLTAIAYTEVPLSFKVLRKQWRRWTIGVLQTLFEHREIFVRMDKYQLLTLQWWFALYGNVIPSLFLPLSYAMIIYGAVSGTLGPIYLFPAIFIAFRAVQTIAAMIILRTKMNPFVAIWYRLINDPLQIYLTVVCYWMVLSGRMPSTRKIWTQVPRSGVAVGGAVTRKVGVDAVQVPEAGVAAEAAVPAEPIGTIEPAQVTADMAVTEAFPALAMAALDPAPAPPPAPVTDADDPLRVTPPATETEPLPMGAPVTAEDPMPSEAEISAASRLTQPIKIGDAVRIPIPKELTVTKVDWARPNGTSEPSKPKIPEELRVTRLDWAREPNGTSEPPEAVHVPEVAHETEEEAPSEDGPAADDVLTEEIQPEEIQR
jgi:cellulose synthase/poly-beta-1,6-N-acetylglucosamine synthase-like glycosyltransferase/peptidoglycan/xylan/chitin deacetylase (PgdA/CDA1 family)